MNSIARLALLPALAFALDDIPVYLDAGCTHSSIPGSYAQGPSDMVLVAATNGKEIPINCKEQLTGTDALEIRLDRALKNGEYWDLQVKTPVDRYFNLKGYADIRFWVKNKLSTPATLRIKGQNARYAEAGSIDTVVAGGGTWQQFVIPLSRISDTALNALGFSQPSTLSPNPIDLLIDSITITDGTRNGSLNIPASVHSPRPANWPSTFLIGGFDNRGIGSTKKEWQSGSYRYQYVMNDYLTNPGGYYSPSKKGYVYDYSRESDTMGVKTSIVFYNLSKGNETYAGVVGSLTSSSYMSAYFTRYDSILHEMARAGQKDYIIVLEPDMYGFLMRGPNGPNYPPIDDPTQIPVNMDAANALAGTTYEPNLKGWATHMVQRAKSLLKDNGVIVGHMPNHWGVSIPGMVGNGRKEAHLISGMTCARFLNGFGPQGIGDVVFVEKTDNDATMKHDADWMWDSTGYAKYLLWTRCIAHGTNLSVVGWQVSEAHTTDPNTSTRDNAAENFLADPQRWIDGGFSGILFGPGNPGNANYQTVTDGNWFIDRMNEYCKAATPLPTTSAIRPAAGPASRTAIRAFPSGTALRLDGWVGTAQVEVVDPSGSRIWSGPLRSGEQVSLPSSARMVLWRVRTGESSATGRVARP